MADRPSASSSSNSPSDYDVFLSFCSKDTKTITSDLYHGLSQAGIATFMANEELKEGDKIWLDLEKANTGSRIYIPIFSINYASSKRCLNQLVQIMESRDTKGQLVLPIFFHIDPGHVRNQIEGFGQQFHLLENIFDKGTVERWKKALREAGDLMGWDLKSAESRNASKVIQSVVGYVSSYLRESSFAVKNLVGIDSCVMTLLNILNVGSKDVRFIGVWGMGGIGKTTVAEAVFERIHRNFQGSIFLEDVREASKQPGGLVCLQNQLLSNILKQEIQHKGNANEGKSFIKNYLHAKKVIICLDDVDKIEQLEALAGGPDWFGLGSRIIITTRDKHVLKVHKVHAIYEAKELDFDHSLRLFSKYAFGKDQPLDDFMKLAEDVVLTAGGLPLALKVLGSFLSDKRSPTVWRSTLHRLRKIPHQDVQEKLKISYNGLDDPDKQLFLDIACFFIGMDKEYATDIGEGCGFSEQIGINLIQKSLVKIDFHNKLRMHDQLRDMGRHIVCQESPNEPGKRSRLWSRDEVLNVLEEWEGTGNVEGIVFKLGEGTVSEKIHVKTEAFEMMCKLRLLQIDNVHLEGDFKKIPSELKWLSWKGCPLEFVPSDFRLEKLAVLDLSYSRIKQVWNDLDENKQFRELKVLNISNCRYLTKAPDFSRIPNLEKLNLEGCIKVKDIPLSICDLKSLKKLILSGCSNVDKLPGWHVSLNQLEVLKLEHCKLLNRLPFWIGNMRNLKTLFLDGTMITELPNSVGLLANIEELTVRKCNKLVRLPDSMREMRLLRRFEIDETSIVSLPKDFGMLSSLQVLRMPGCREFMGFPENFGNLIQLRDLNVRDNSSLYMLPNSFSGLCSLASLDASGCNLSKGGIPIDFGKLSSLKKLYLSYNNFRSLPVSIGALSRLESLVLDNCRSLQSLPGIPSSLRNLNVKNCISMEMFSNLSYLKNLRILDISYCEKLAKIRGIEKMESLQELWMSGCSRALVDSVKKSFGQLLLQRLRLCSFPESEIPYWFIPLTLKVSDSLIWSERGQEIRLECEEVPTRLWSPEQNRKIIGVLLCLVFTNQPEISPITLIVEVKKNGGCVYSNSGHSFVILSRRHQDQICFCQFRDCFGNFVSELEVGDEISFIIQTGLETEVKKAGMYVVYEDTRQSTYKSRGDFFTCSYDDDDDDDDNIVVVDDDDCDDGVVVIDDGDDDSDAVDGGGASRKRKKLQPLHHDDVDDSIASSFVIDDGHRPKGSAGPQLTSFTYSSLIDSAGQSPEGSAGPQQTSSTYFSLVDSVDQPGGGTTRPQLITPTVATSTDIADQPEEGDAGLELNLSLS